jgi:hypothetical protein
MATTGNSNKGTGVSVRSMLKCYKQDRCSNEFAVRQWPASKDMNMEAKIATALEAVTRRQLVRTQQTEKSWWML